MTPDHAYDLARALAAENAELRELLVAVAQELERPARRGRPRRRSWPGRGSKPRST